MIALPSIAALRVLCCLVAARGGAVSARWIMRATGLNLVRLQEAIGALRHEGYCICTWPEIGYQLWEPVG